MEPEIAALATSAGTTVVTLMATDAWHRTRDGIVSLWTGVHPERAESIAAELAATREDVIAARSDGDENVEPELQREWQGRVRRLLAAQWPRSCVPFLNSDQK